MGRLDRIYSRLPVWGQHAAVSAFGGYWKWLRFGPGFAGYVAEYQARDRFTAAEWAAWQTRRLSEVLEDAMTRVPHYRMQWGSGEIRAARAGALRDLPLLGKEPVRADARQFVQQGVKPWPELTFHTSGSTGTPIATIWRADELRRSMAIREVRSAGWAGVSFSRPRATFSGRMAEPNPDSRGPFHRFNLAERQAYLSPFHLRPDSARQYIDALRRHRIEWLTGYAVSHYLLARHVIEQGLAAPPLKAVITTSEKLTHEMRATIERAYGCGVFEEYSTVENVLFASECERGRLHLSPDSAMVEILRPDGSPCDPEEPGEVVATCLLRDHQPLIRYRLGDVAAWDPRPCPCGRAMPVLKEVVGRVEDVVVAPDGRELVRFHGVFVDQPRVREAQVVQERRDRLRINVVAADGFGEADRLEIVRRVHQRVGAEIDVVVACVDHIPRTAAGKFAAVVSLVRAAHAASAR